MRSTVPVPAFIVLIRECQISLLFIIKLLAPELFFFNFSTPCI